MTTSAPFVIMENAHRTGERAVVPTVHPALDPHGILRPVAVLPVESPLVITGRGPNLTATIRVRYLVAFDYPGRVSA
jgi:hypothetical protein